MQSPPPPRAPAPWRCVLTAGLAATLLASASCVQRPRSCGAPATTTAARARALLWEGTGSYRYPVRTTRPEAQRYFDQGLAFSHGFNHDEAARSFVEARTLDPACAMAWWGEAYAAGPNYNLQLPGLYGGAAYEAIQGALARRSGAAPVEAALIEALATRFEDPAPEGPEGVARLNRAYADAMAGVWRRFPDDAEVGFLYADALMNLRPWRLYDQQRVPHPETLVAIEVLERVLAHNRDHPGANHLYIHAIEPSNTPRRAEAVADRLGALTPGLGHMVHMPAHIYVRLGRYADSVAVNRRASDLDRAYFARARGPQGVYHFYHLHNDHFLVWSEMFRGRDRAALVGCDDLDRDMPAHLRSDPFAAEFLTVRYHVLIRFGRWQELVESRPPPADQPYAVAHWHYAKGVAYANLGRFEEAAAEARAFEEAARKVPEGALVAVVVDAHDVLEVARQMLAGETAFKRGDAGAAFEHLRAAVAAEDALPYTEPSPWMFPSRHALGALLLQEGRVEEAEATYREDLLRYPENGWSLHGLAECLERRGRTSEAADVHRRFAAAWKHATVQLKGSCFCRTK